jgi:hypothetical protein
MKRIANYAARDYVRKTEAFTGNNIFAHWVKGEDEQSRYVVFSYEPHWPLFIWCPVTERWFANASKISRTTSKHHTQTHPLPQDHPAIPLHVDDMIKVAHAGVTALIPGLHTV